MYEYHGWIRILYHPHDTNSELQVACFWSVKFLADEYYFPFINFFEDNGMYSCHFSGQHNHKSHEVLEFFEKVGERAAGSYGVLNIRDDEDPLYQNKMQKFLLKKGKFYSSIETELSPCSPVIEDPYDPSRND